MLTCIPQYFLNWSLGIQKINTEIFTERIGILIADNYFTMDWFMY